VTLPAVTLPAVTFRVVTLRAVVLRAIGLGLWLLGGATPVAAESLLPAALDSGSARLTLYVLAQERRPGSDPFIDRLLRDLGAAHPRGAGPQRLSRGARVAPILEWDDNVNGGTPGGVFTIGGLDFTVDEASQARAGLMLGASLGLGASYSIGRGMVLRFAVNGTLRHAPREDATKSSLGASVCGSLPGGEWTWWDACLSASAARTELSRQSERAVSVARTVVFPSGIGVHEARIGARYVLGEDFRKPVLTLGLVTAADFGAVVVSAELSPEVEGRNTTLFGARAALTRPVLGASTTVEAGYRRTGGSAFFGDERSDDIWSLGVTRDIGRGVSATLSVSRTLSTVDLYDQTSVYVGVDVAGWRF
jgi:hypothetical protein